jgi:protein-arginine kinase
MNKFDNLVSEMMVSESSNLDVIKEIRLNLSRNVSSLKKMDIKDDYKNVLNQILTHLKEAHRQLGYLKN